MVPDQMVKVKWNNANKNFYENKGCIYTKKGDEFEVDINDLSVGSHSLIYFICDYCLGEKQTTKESKTRVYKNHMRNKTDKDCCIYCRSEMLEYTHKKRIIKHDNKLSIRFPEIINQWSNKNDKSPDEYGYTSSKVVWWTCDKGHEWEESIIRRHSRGNIVPCPICSSLRNTHPHIVEEWNYNKNKELSPDNISKGSDKKVWWIGKCGHEWKSSVSHRVSGENCPYCAGKKVNETNCLATLNPYLLSQWDFNKNEILSPYKISLKSNKNAWWKCEQGHSWNARISSRANGNDCPICFESKGEKVIRNILERNGVKFISQYEYDDLVGVGGKPLKFDFAIVNKFTKYIELLIEYDGEFHFNKIYNDDNYETLLLHDKRKNDYCKDNNIPLFRIPYWEFDNIEEILTCELNKYF